MRVAVFDTRRYDRQALEEANDRFAHELVFFEERLVRRTARLAEGFQAICSFVNDQLDRPTLQLLAELGVRLIALRCAGFNHVDLEAAGDLGLAVVRVPEYSPYAVAEHAVGLLLTLNRKLHRAYARVREANFSLDGLVGFDLYGQTVGIIGTGRIGSVFARIMHGFGCRLLAYDLEPNEELSLTLGVDYVPLDRLYAESDIISLHVPLTPATHHMIDSAALAKMKKGVLLINTSRGALVDTKALIKSLKTGYIGGAGLDVYEEEEDVFFKDLSDQVLLDDVLARLLTFLNVFITAHQGFLTREALRNIAVVTLTNISEFERGEPLTNALTAATRVRAC